MKKSLKANYIYNLLYQILVMVLPLITTPYLSRTLGAEKIGIYSFTLSILSYFILFGCLGINLYGQREIAMVQEDENKRSKVFWALFILKLITLLISFTVFAIFNFTDSVYGIYYKILTIELFSNIFDITWFFQGLEDFKKVTIRNTIVRLFSTLLIFLFIKNENDLVFYFLIYCGCNFLSCLTLWYDLKKYVKKVKINFKDIFNHIKPTISLFLPQIAIQIYTVLDKTMLGFILGDMYEVGYYEQSQKIVKMCLMLITALGTVMIPRIANLFANNKQTELNEKIVKMFNVVLIAALPMSFGLLAISKDFVPWFFSDGYSSVISLLSIFSFLIIAIGLNNITGMQYLIPTKKQNAFTISVIVGAIINFVLNLLLIPKLSGNGAAISTVTAEFCIFLIQAFYIRKIFNFKLILKNNIKYLFSSLIMFVIVYIVGIFMDSTILTTFIQILVGGIIYVFILFILKDGLLNQLINIIKKKLKVGHNEKNSKKTN